MSGSSDASMEQVRELLMGTQFKEMENRLKHQEERLMREICGLGENLRERLKVMEAFMTSENASLLSRLQEEQAARAEAVKTEQRERVESVKNEQRERAEAIKNEQAARVEAILAEQQERADALLAEQRERGGALLQLANELTRELEAKEDALERKIAAVSSKLDSAEHELRQLLMSENAKLSEKVDEKYRSAMDALSSTSGELRNDLVSRASIAGIFTQAAVRLAGQWPAENDDKSKAAENVAATGEYSGPEA